MINRLLSNLEDIISILISNLEDVMAICLSQGSLVGEMDGDHLLSLLRCVPETVNSDLLGRWVSCYVVPFILQHLHQALVSHLSVISENME